MKLLISNFTRIILFYCSFILFFLSVSEITRSESLLSLQFPPFTDNADHYRVNIRGTNTISGTSTDVNTIYTNQLEYSTSVSDVWKYYFISIQAIDQYGIQSPESSALVFSYADITTGIMADMGNPISFALKQNVPNPFNSSTKITYDLIDDGHVSILIYNISGQVVKKLEDQYLEKGTHTLIWNASGQPSGIYFYCLSTPGGVVTRKMMLMK